MSLCCAGCCVVLQAALAPVLLRRMKEDVEDLPEKEEVVIWVELTPEQRRWDRRGFSAAWVRLPMQGPQCTLGGASVRLGCAADAGTPVRTACVCWHRHLQVMGVHNAGGLYGCVERCKLMVFVWRAGLFCPRYYRALYSQQIGTLLGGVSNKNLPGMRNLAMELRKLCCHPVSAWGCRTSV